MARCSSWGLDFVPDQVVAITAGVDLQLDRIEVEICGWGAGEESWSLDYLSLPGNPADKELWARLDEVLARRFPHRMLGSLAIAVTCIDSGNWSKLVYEFCGPRFHKQIFADQRLFDPSSPIWPRRPSRPKDGRQSNLFSVGSTAAKEIVVSRLGIAGARSGLLSFPRGARF